MVYTHAHEVDYTLGDRVVDTPGYQVDYSGRLQVVQSSAATDTRNTATSLKVMRRQRSPDAVADGLARGFVGIKPYPGLAPGAMEQAGIFDLGPRQRLQVSDGSGGTLMLQLPRPGSRNQKAPTGH